MIRRTRDKFGLYPEILAADQANGSAENLNWLLHQKGILPHIPVFDKSKRKGRVVSNSAFVFSHEADEVILPERSPRLMPMSMLSSGEKRWKCYSPTSSVSSSSTVCVVEGQTEQEMSSISQPQPKITANSQS